MGQLWRAGVWRLTSPQRDSWLLKVEDPTDPHSYVVLKNDIVAKKPFGRHCRVGAPTKIRVPLPQVERGSFVADLLWQTAGRLPESSAACHKIPASCQNLLADCQSEWSEWLEWSGWSE